jgi:hypothetical protein
MMSEERANAQAAREGQTFSRGSRLDYFFLVTALFIEARNLEK